MEDMSQFLRKSEMKENVGVAVHCKVMYIYLSRYTVNHQEFWQIHPMFYGHILTSEQIIKSVDMFKSVDTFSAFWKNNTLGGWLYLKFNISIGPMIPKGSLYVIQWDEYILKIMLEMW